MHMVAKRTLHVAICDLQYIQFKYNIFWYVASIITVVYACSSYVREHFMLPFATSSTILRSIVSMQCILYVTAVE